MPHPNAELLWAHLDAMSRGDVPAAMTFYSDDAVFHYPGHNPLSGDHRGKDEILALLSRAFELTDGSFRPEIHDILASDDHVAVLTIVHATRAGTPVEWQAVDLYHVQEGKITEHWVHEVDQELVDRFWSATDS